FARPLLLRRGTGARARPAGAGEADAAARRAGRAKELRVYSVTPPYWRQAAGPRLCGSPPWNRPYAPNSFAPSQPPAGLLGADHARQLDAPDLAAAGERERVEEPDQIRYFVIRECASAPVFYFFA